MYFDFNKRQPVQPMYFAQSSNLSNEQINLIRNIGDSLTKTNVKIYGDHDKKDVDADGSHFKLTEQTQSIYEHLAERCKHINDYAYQYDLEGFTENFYYLKYDHYGSHFNYHFDAGPQTPKNRKLSFIVQLSDPSEHQGGNLEFLVGSERTVTVKKEKGLLVAFPSHFLHRVTPLISGTRRSLVLFAGGPKFR